MKLKRKTMNKLLNPISWSTYLETITVLAAIYYAFIGWKYYRPEISRLFARISGAQGDDRKLPAVLSYQPKEHAAAADHTNETKIAQSFPAMAKPAIGETDRLGQDLTACIASVSDKPFAPAVLIPKLKKILNDYPDIAATTDREQINALIVRECEETGTALLTEEEVDQWWSA